MFVLKFELRENCTIFRVSLGKELKFSGVLQKIIIEILNYNPKKDFEDCVKDTVKFSQ